VFSLPHTVDIGSFFFLRSKLQNNPSGHTPQNKLCFSRYCWVW